jgi:hypothetical protein
MQPGVVNTAMVVALVAAAVAVGGVLYWIASRKRIAADTAGRAEERARTLLRDAEREAENGKKEALLEAKEKAHQLVMEADRLAETRRQQTARLEQVLAKKEEKVTERLSAAEQHEKDLRTREQGIRDREKATTAAVSRYEQLIAEQQQELQRVAGLTADEAKELLLRQFESDARRDAANLVKRLESEARETATARAKQIVTEAIQRSAPEHATETTVSVVTCRATTEGPDHRARGPQHPCARDRDGRRPDRRRHARGDHPLRVRPVPAGNRQAGDRAADRRRPHPPGAHRRSGRESEAGARRRGAPRGRGGSLRAGPARPGPDAAADAS